MAFSLTRAPGSGRGNDIFKSETVGSRTTQRERETDGVKECGRRTEGEGQREIVRQRREQAAL